MKTLDEVIHALEKCTDYDAECEGCPYRDDNKGGLECVMKNLEEVLHYLKEYRAGKDDLERTKKMCFEFVGTKMIEAEKQGRTLACPNCGDEFIILPERNDPLDWETLKQMEGKPVWMEEFYPVMEDETGATEDEGYYNKHWDIIRKVYPKQIAFYVQGMTNHKEWIGKTWQAYRKERE